MQLKPPNPPPGENQRLWDQWCRAINVAFSDGEVPTAALDNNAVTNLKLNDMPALSVKARSANSSGDPVDLQASANGQYLQRNGDLLLFDSLSANDVLQHVVAIRSFMPRPEPRADEFQIMMASRVFATR